MACLCDSLFCRGISDVDGCDYEFTMMSKKFEKKYGWGDGDTFTKFCADCEAVHDFREAPMDCSHDK